MELMAGSITGGVDLLMPTINTHTTQAELFLSFSYIYNIDLDGSR